MEEGRENVRVGKKTLTLVNKISRKKQKKTKNRKYMKTQKKNYIKNRKKSSTVENKTLAEKNREVETGEDTLTEVMEEYCLELFFCCFLVLSWSVFPSIAFLSSSDVKIRKEKEKHTEVENVNEEV